MLRLPNGRKRNATTTAISTPEGGRAELLKATGIKVSDPQVKRDRDTVGVLKACGI